MVAHKQWENKENYILVAYIVCHESYRNRFDEANLRSHLLSKVPEYMVPSIFITLDTLPLTPSGKIDRKALPQPNSAKMPTHEYVPPRKKIEKALVEIWATVLHKEPKSIGIHDNFFELGGDSILSIQVASRAHKQGIVVTTRQLFEHQTIEKLAHHAKNISIKIDQAAIKGELSLLPIQRWFLQGEIQGKFHFHQSFLLQVPESFNLNFLRLFTNALIKRHDALRLCFSYNEKLESWKATHIPLSDSLVDRIIVKESIQGKTLDQRKEFILAKGKSIKNNFSIDQVPLLKIVYFKADTSTDSRLLLVAHHLIIDGVSWRIIFDDLISSFQQWQKRKILSLSSKTSSYQRWGAKIAECRNIFFSQKDYWLKMLAPAPFIPRDNSISYENHYGNTEFLKIELNSSDTSELLNNCPQAYHTQISDLLLSALLLALFRWRGLTAVTLIMEGHGRESDDDIDLTATIGWFTTMFPLRLHIPEEAIKDNSIGALIKVVKEQYRLIPQKGIGFGVLRYIDEDTDLVEIENIVKMA